MKLNKIIKDFERGYNRPTTLPVWKLMIDYLFWIVALVSYILAAIISPYIVISGIIFQGLALYLPYKWDTGSWRNTEKGKEFIDKYGE